MFGICFGIIFLSKLIYLKIKEKREEPKTSDDPKIYYIKNTAAERKKRKRPTKKTDVALKGIVLKPEEFEKIRGK